MLGLRPITPADNAAVARVIRTVMPEFGCVGEGYSIEDPEVDDMYAAYDQPGAAFFALAPAGVGGTPSDDPGDIVGVGGYAPLVGGPAGTCELRKMYILREGRGRGGGRLLLDACLREARAAGYATMYLETVAAMTTAAAVYRKYGFTYVDAPMGGTGHSGCDRFMVLAL